MMQYPQLGSLTATLGKAPDGQQLLQLYGRAVGATPAAAKWLAAAADGMRAACQLGEPGSPSRATSCTAIVRLLCMKLWRLVGIALQLRHLVCIAPVRRQYACCAAASYRLPAPVRLQAPGTCNVLARSATGRHHAPVPDGKLTTAPRLLPRLLLQAQWI